MRIFLTGMPGSGKSYWATQVADALGYAAIDLDNEIEVYAQSSIPEIFKNGEAHFREIETTVLRRTIDLYGEKVVISTGGGLVISEHNRALMRQHGKIVYLHLDTAQLLQNLNNDKPNQRPLIGADSAAEQEQKLLQLYHDRKRFYTDCHLIVHVRQIDLPTFVSQLKNNFDDLNQHTDEHI
ncbi:MAG: shikimate kinase [Edaphocola sp.]